MIDLNEYGIKPNRYRKDIWQYLEESEGHPTPYMIFDHLKQKYPYMSLATVYNNLILFKEKKLVISFRGTDNSEHYEIEKGPHAHFICENCNKIVNLDKIEVAETGNKGVLKKYKINRSSIFLYGICPDCSKK